MIKGKELLGRHVVDLSTGERVDSVRDIVFDHGANLVLGLVVDGGGHWLRRRDRLIPFSVVYSVGEDAVMITSAQKASSEAEQARMKEVLTSDVNLVGMALVTEAGEDLGRIADVVFDEYSGQVEGYEVTGGLFAKGAGKTAFMPAPQGSELKVGKDSATVPASLAEQMRRSGGRWPNEAAPQEHQVEELRHAATQSPSPAPGTPPEPEQPAMPTSATTAEQAEALAQKRREALVGRLAGASIVLPDGTVVVEKGEMITEEQVIRAERSGRLMVMYSTLQPADEPQVQQPEQATVQNTEAAPTAPLDPLDVGEYQRQPAAPAPAPVPVPAKPAPRQSEPPRQEETPLPVAEVQAQPQPESRPRTQPIPQPQLQPQTPTPPQPIAQPQPQPPAGGKGHAMRVRPEQVVRTEPTPDFKPGLLEQAKGWLANLREDLTTDPQQRKLVQVHEQTGTPIQRLEKMDSQEVREPKAAPQKPQATQQSQPPVLAQTKPAAPQPQTAPKPAAQPPQPKPQPQLQAQSRPKPEAEPQSQPQPQQSSAPAEVSAAALTTDIDLDIDLTPLTRATAPTPSAATQTQAQSQAAQTQVAVETAAPVPEKAPQPVIAATASAAATVPEPKPAAPDRSPSGPAARSAPPPTPVATQAESPSESTTKESRGAEPSGPAADATDLAAFNQAIEAIVKSAYGWPVTRTIQAPTGEIVLEEGGRVNAAVAQEARRLGVLRELLDAVARAES